MLVLEPQKSICFQILPEPKLSSALTHQSGASGSPVGENHHSSLGKGGGSVPSHTTQSISNSTQTSWGRSGIPKVSSDGGVSGSPVRGRHPVIFGGKMAPASKPQQSD